MSTEDVSKLFKSFGGDPERYRDFSGESNAKSAKGKWDLLSGVSIPEIEAEGSRKPVAKPVQQETKIAPPRKLSASLVGKTAPVLKKAVKEEKKPVIEQPQPVENKPSIKDRLSTPKVKKTTFRRNPEQEPKIELPKPEAPKPTVRFSRPEKQEKSALTKNEINQRLAADEVNSKSSGYEQESHDEPKTSNPGKAEKELAKVFSRLGGKKQPVAVKSRTAKKLSLSERIFNKD